MPELAEVEVVCNQLNQKLQDSILSEANLVYPKWLKYGQPREQIGQKVSFVKRWGKRIVFSFENKNVWVQSLGMTGSILINDVQQKHPMLETAFENKRVTFYDPRHFGSLFCFSNFQEAQNVVGNKIGLDAAEPISRQKLAQLFTGRKVAIKAALLNQTPLAGIGNYLADEILWHAQINPKLSTNLLNDKDWSRLNTAKEEIIALALSKGGLSIKDYVHVDGSKGNMKSLLKAYGQAGNPCQRCSTQLQKTVVAGRGTVFCPECQARAL